MDLTDKELARLIVRKNENAFTELIKKYGGLIKSIVGFHLKDISMWRDDCVSDVLLSIWQNIDRFDAEKSTLKNWIGAIAKYRAINYKRKYYRELTDVELYGDIADKNEVDADILRQEIEQETISLLSGLNEKDKEIFIRRYLMEQSVDDISEATHKKASWIYNRLSRGRKKLRHIYDGKWSDGYEKRV